MDIIFGIWLSPPGEPVGNGGGANTHCLGEGGLVHFVPVHIGCHFINKKIQFQKISPQKFLVPSPGTSHNMGGWWRLSFGCFFLASQKILGKVWGWVLGFVLVFRSPKR